MYQDAGRFTGHLSFDFLVQTLQTDRGMEKIILPIECNPRCHTATVLFEGLEDELAQIYLSVLGDVPEHMLLLTPGASTDMLGHFWVAHDLVVLFLMPLMALILGKMPWQEYFSALTDFATHLSRWKDPTFEKWDPIPFLVLNHVYWPLRLIRARLDKQDWKQLNVSTTKMFLA